VEEEFHQVQGSKVDFEGALRASGRGFLISGLIMPVAALYPSLTRGPSHCALSALRGTSGGATMTRRLLSWGRSSDRLEPRPFALPHPNALRPLRPITCRYHIIPDGMIIPLLEHLPRSGRRGASSRLVRLGPVPVVHNTSDATNIL
jgi:hypothetical protein